MIELTHSGTDIGNLLTILTQRNHGRSFNHRIPSGFVSMTGPLYIAEQLPSDWRGPMTVCNQLLITIGILAGSIVAGIFEPVTHGWR